MVFPYLSFSGNCAQALEFYQEVFQVSAHIMRYKDAPQDPDNLLPDSMKDWVLHADMYITASRVSFADVTMEYEIMPGNNITLCLELQTPEEVFHYYNLLKEEGTVFMEAAPQFFSPMFAYIKDKFNVQWQIMAAPE